MMLAAFFGEDPDPGLRGRLLRRHRRRRRSSSRPFCPPSVTGGCSPPPTWPGWWSAYRRRRSPSSSSVVSPICRWPPSDLLQACAILGDKGRFLGGAGNWRRSMRTRPSERRRHRWSWSGPVGPSRSPRPSSVGRSTTTSQRRGDPNSAPGHASPRRSRGRCGDHCGTFAGHRAGRRSRPRTGFRPESVDHAGIRRRRSGPPVPGPQPLESPPSSQGGGLYLDLASAEIALQRPSALLQLPASRPARGESRSTRL